MYWEATRIVLTSRSMESLVFHLQFTNHSLQSPLISILYFKTKLFEAEYAWVWQNLSFLSCWDLLHSCWLTGFLDVYLSTTLKLRPEFDFYMKLIYHTERTSAELGYGRGMNAWAVAHQRLLFSHIYSKSFIIHWINNCNVIVNSFKGKNTLLKLALN